MPLEKYPEANGDRIFGRPSDGPELAALQMTQDEFTKLMNLRRKVVEMNLTWVEWRSCDLGKRPEVWTGSEFFLERRVWEPRCRKEFSATARWSSRRWTGSTEVYGRLYGV